jgi:hypothetical protein
MNNDVTCTHLTFPTLNIHNRYVHAMCKASPARRFQQLSFRVLWVIT